MKWRRCTFFVFLAIFASTPASSQSNRERASIICRFGAMSGGAWVTFESEPFDATLSPDVLAAGEPFFGFDKETARFFTFVLSKYRQDIDMYDNSERYNVTAVECSRASTFQRNAFQTRVVRTGWRPTDPDTPPFEAPMVYRLTEVAARKTYFWKDRWQWTSDCMIYYSLDGVPNQLEAGYNLYDENGRDGFAASHQFQQSRLPLREAFERPRFEAIIGQIDRNLASVKQACLASLAPMGEPDFRSCGGSCLPMIGPKRAVSGGG